MSSQASGSMPKYARIQVLLHWTTVVLLLISFFSHEAMKDAWRALRRGTEGFEPAIGTQVHVIVGILVLALTAIRVVVRITKGAPPPVEGQSRLLTVLAAIVHGLLYVVLLAIPASGLAAWFGGITDAGEVHEVLFNLGLVLLLAHIGAALFHQFVLKDRLLARMR